jgi:hypothetical protein
MAKNDKKRPEIPESAQEPSENDADRQKTKLFDLSKGKGPLDSDYARGEPVELEKLSLTELLALRAEIDELLPARQLSDLNLEEEVLLQFQQTKALYTRVAEDKNTPANQKAQVANSCTTILDQLIKMQRRLYAAERVKAMESALIKSLRELGEERVSARFFEIYERALEQLSAVDTMQNDKDKKQ